MMNQKFQKKDTHLQKKDNKLLMNQGQYNNTIMEYQNQIALTQTSKFGTKNCVEKNDESRETCNTNPQIKSKTTM